MPPSRQTLMYSFSVSISMLFETYCVISEEKGGPALLYFGSRLDLQQELGLDQKKELQFLSSETSPSQVTSFCSFDIFIE